VETGLRFGPLSKMHDRTGFSCGSAPLDRWFATQAGQDERRGITRVFVAVDDEGIAGFYTLSMFSLALDSLPAELAHRLPRYPDVPAALIGRLARAERLRGRRVGELLVADALKRIVAAIQTVAAFAIIVDAKDDRARAFYDGLGFKSFPSRPDRLFMLAETAAAAILDADAT
jgi:ribosomal protein S18 acetylase RimI-like enzyme